MIAAWLTKAQEDDFRYETISLFVEWIIFVLGIAVIYRGNSAERNINLLPLSSYFNYGGNSYLIEKVVLNILNVALFVPVGFLLGCGFRGMIWKKVLGFGAVLFFNRIASVHILQRAYVKLTI